MPWRKKEILRNLLRDCTCPAHRTFGMACVFLLSAFDFDHVEAMMRVEALVFGRDECFIELWRDIAPVETRMFPCNRLSGEEMIECSEDHHCCDRRIDEAKNHDLDNRKDDAEDRDFPGDGPNPFAERFLRLRHGRVVLVRLCF